PVSLAFAAAVAAPRTGDALAGRADQTAGDGLPARSDVCRSIRGAGADGFRGARMTAAASIKSPATLSARDSHTAAPEVAVLMTAYNAQHYLAEALDSILNQTFGDFELVVVDDGSTDKTLSILENYARRDPR